MLYAHISLVLATLVQIIAVKEFIPTSSRSLYRFHFFDMDFLLAISTTAAYLFGVVSYVHQVVGKPLPNRSFFETSTLLDTLILLGRVLIEFVRYQVVKSVAISALQAKDVILAISSTSTPIVHVFKKMDARILQHGDSFKVLPHTRIVTDGVVSYGGSEVDESMITGESNPVAKGVHSTVFAGTMNGSGVLVVKLTALPHENSVHRIAAMLENTALTTPKIQTLTDGILRWLVPTMAVISFVGPVIRLFIDRLYVKDPWTEAGVKAIIRTIAILVLFCPCAVALAVPVVVLIARSIAARFGIIYRNPQKLNNVRNVTDIVFEKTGVLTCGHPLVVHQNYHDADDVVTKCLLLGLLKSAQHPTAIAVFRHLEKDMYAYPEKRLRPVEVVDITDFPGQGIRGVCPDGGAEILAGDPELLGIEVEETTSTVFCVTIGGELRATFHLLDRPRHTAELVIEKLHARSIAVHMFSSDCKGAACDTAHSLNIHRNYLKWRCSAEDTQYHVTHLRGPGKVVMFVGTNPDSDAMKAADIGVHIQQDRDAAHSTADIVLMTTRLHDILIMLDISRAAHRRIMINLGWAIVYNTVAFALAAGAFVKAGDRIKMSPPWAGLSEVFGLIPVMLVAFQMYWMDYGKQYRSIEYKYMRAEKAFEEKVRTRVGGSFESSEEPRCCIVSPNKRR